jgi:hypothetical protein
VNSVAVKAQYFIGVVTMWWLLYVMALCMMFVIGVAFGLEVEEK